MTVKKTHYEQQAIYFITFTCYQWLPLIRATDLYDDIYKWFDILKKDRHAVLGYVIMPNHMHVLLYYNTSPRTINQCIAEGKKFRAWEIIKRLKKLKAAHYLSRMDCDLAEDSRTGKQRYQAFEVSFDCKVCFNKQMLLQKLEYIHRNPISKGHKLAETMSDYPHSSARFYLHGEHAAYPVEHYEKYMRDNHNNRFRLMDSD
jgi:REP element-mobilizing transposase RayT